MKLTYKSLSFSAIKDQFLGANLSPIYAKTAESYQRWFNRSQTKLSAVESREKIKQYMPELIPTYDGLCKRFGGDEQTCTFLSLFNPPAFKSGCSQAFRNHDTVELVRNYDFPAQLCDRLMLHSNWNGTRVIAMTDCLWGVIDGMNEHGLAVSLSYGGRNKQGHGFGITLVLRYILEFCKTTQEAVEKLKQVPIHMAYNVTLIDALGNGKTVVICPGEKVEVTTVPFATNHQQGGTLGEVDAIADSYVREQYLSVKLSKMRVQSPSLVELFLQPPLLRLASDWNGWGTLYTASYQPVTKMIHLYWPQSQVLTQSFDNFIETDLTVYSDAFASQ